MLMPVILSGGAGTRLWPVSREAHPKPFMHIGDAQSLLQKAIARGLAASAMPDCAIVTNKEHFFLTKDEIATMDQAVSPTLLLEPASRNTAPAVALAALWTSAMHGPETIMLILPADQLVRDLDAFCSACAAAETLAATGRLVLFGIQPSVPETGFGYIELGEALKGTRVHAVERFVEKPNLEKAIEYVASGRFVWNSGMFCFRADAILAALARHCPAVMSAAQACWDSASRDSGSPLGERIDFGAEGFVAMPGISIDYAVMEHADNLAVVSCDFGWSDVGSWKAYSDQLPPDEHGNTSIGNPLLIDSNNCHVQSDGRMVAAIGINDLVVVDTVDALLVASRERTQDVRLIVEQLRLSGHESIRLHQTTSRPWGTYTVLEEGPHFKIKHIEVKPDQSLSLQMHHHRSEHWVVVSGTAWVTNGEREFSVAPNESTYIPAMTKHRLENRGANGLVLIEVQCGPYLGEDDIIRFSDIYQRA